MPPGATVRDVLAERGMTVPVFARLMGFSEARAEAFLCGDALLTPEIAAALEKILGVPARFWRNLELSGFGRRYDVITKGVVQSLGQERLDSSLFLWPYP